jgi:hypothetical protein
MQRCLFCDEPRPLVKAHVVPQSFFAIEPQAAGNTPRLFTSIEGSFPKKAPIGVYDQGILCSECEAEFSDVDGYAAKLLLQGRSDFKPIPKNGPPRGFEVWQYDYGRLKRFFMSVLWRASVSSHIFYSKVTLGSIERRLRATLRAKDIGDADSFAVVLWTYDDHPFATIEMDPLRTRVDGINCYRFRMHRYVVWIKVDKRPFQQEFRNVQLSPASPLLILHANFEGSQDHQLAQAMARGERPNRKADYL